MDKKDNLALNYEDAIVKKPWGYEYLVFENEFVAIWMLHIVRKRKTSMHCHPGKNTGLFLLSGSATFYSLEGSIELTPLDSVMIRQGVYHCTEASSTIPIDPQSENGILIVEIESPPIKTDLVRMDDEYGRAGTSYEGVDQMVFKPKECLKFKLPKKDKIVRREFLNYIFTVQEGGFDKSDVLPRPDSLVCIIGKKDSINKGNPYLEVGELRKFKDLYKNTTHEELRNYFILTIEKSEKLTKLSDYIFSYLAGLGLKDVFLVCGGTAMHLVDSVGKNKDIRYIATHHEQAAAMAAEAHARMLNKPSVVLVSSGPGTTNALTGLYSAWIDSIPIIFISGQVTTSTLVKQTGLRQFGAQEADIVRLVKPITKYSATITDPCKIKYHIEKAVFMATEGRPGPVWLDIPLDIQSKMIDLNELVSFDKSSIESVKDNSALKDKVRECIDLLRNSQRPVVITGYGIRLSKGEKEFTRLIETFLKIPVVSSWSTIDLMPTGHSLYIGRSGIMGDRAGNFSVQNSDLLLIIGSRMSIPQVGYNYNTFAREAKKIVVDIDEKELKKPSLKIDLPINSDAREFMLEMLSQLNAAPFSIDRDEWLKKCRSWKKRYPVVLQEYKDVKGKVNSFYFIDVLSERLDKNATVVTDVGTSLISTMQAFKAKPGQRLFASSGHASMGSGLPGSIGASVADKKRKTICISGDGGLQMNIQELQTLVHYKLPVIVFVLNNGGYLSIKLMQQNHFGRYVASNKDSGLSCPDIIEVANAYGIKSERISDHDDLHEKIDTILAQPGPFICEVKMSENQPLIPRVSSIKTPDGTIISLPLEDLYPFLDRKEFFSNMIVRPIEILEK